MPHHLAAGAALLSMALSFVFTPGCRSAPVTGTEESLSTGGTMASVNGWEGFFRPRSLDDAWLKNRGIGLSASTVRGVTARVVKLSLDDGPREASASALEAMQKRYCTRPEVLAWNEDRCLALDQRQCKDKKCRYNHFGNCTGLLIGNGAMLTAAHCVAGLKKNPDSKARSAILRSGPDGLPAERLAFGLIELGKRDFDHHWVVVDPEEDPVDVASVQIEDGGLPGFPRAPLPQQGEVVFIAGYPRVERRSQADRKTVGYSLTFGTLSVSFGRMADRNTADLPLCNVDGNQEHWALAGTCPTKAVTVDGFDTWRGVITNSPFLTTYDSCNGYSGAPVLDKQGRLVGVNVTLVSRTDPQERFDPEARMAVIPVDRAYRRLDLVSR